MATTTATTTSSTILGKGEELIREDLFTANLVLFWLKADYTLTNKRLTGHTPNTFLGVIPFGKAQIDQPLKAVSSVYSSTKFYFKRLFFGLVLLIVGLYLFDTSLMLSFLIAVVGLLQLLNCYTSTFVVTNNAGHSRGYELSILEKSKVESFVNKMNSAVADL